MGAAASRLIDGDEQLAIGGVALAETAFVLQKTYGVPRSIIVKHLIELLAKSNVYLLGLDKAVAMSELARCAPSARISFADALIAADCRSHGLARIYTFDEDFPAEALERQRPV